MKVKTLSIALLFSAICKAQPAYDWAKSFNSSNGNSGREVVRDASGNVYTSGIFRGTVDFDPGIGVESLTSAGGGDVFITKFDAAGNFVWAKKMGGPTNDNGQSLKVDAVGNVYTTGRFIGTADFDPGVGVSDLISAGQDDIFISKLDAAGNFVWAKNIGNAMTDIVNAIEIDAAGNLFITGSFAGTVDFDAGPGTQNLTSSGGTDIFILKLDATGNFGWAKNIGSATNDEGYSIAVDATGNVYTTGQFTGTVDFDPGTGVENLISAGDFDMFILKLDASGNFIYTKGLGGINAERPQSIALDADGNVYTTGAFRGTADFDPGAGVVNLNSEGLNDIFISKLDVSGNFVWANRIGSTDSDEGYSIKIDAVGNVYTVGVFRVSTDFDPGPGIQTLTSAGSADIFILKLDASGNYVWARRLGSAITEVSYSLALAGTDNFYITGVFAETIDFDPSAGTQNLISSGLGDAFIAHYIPISLPLTLLQFQAEKNAAAVQLQWQTTQEENTASIIIERSIDGKDFAAIGSVEAANNTLKNNYAFNDTKPLEGTGFYRLKMIDIDGKFTYSRIVSVRRNDNGAALLISPNPAKNVLYVQAKGSEPVTVQITDVNGRILQQQKITLNGNTSFSVNVQQLLPGNYYLLLQGKQLKQVQAFVRQ